MVLNLLYLSELFDIDITPYIIFYENKNIKFRTITTGNLNKIKNIIDEVVLNDEKNFISLPEFDSKGNSIILKNIFQVHDDNKKTNIKNIFEECIILDHPINIVDLLSKNIKGIEIDYFLKFCPKNKFVPFDELENIKITELSSLF
jgi:hypothetical protein